MADLLSPSQLGTILVDAVSPNPLYQQIYEGFRQAILSGQLPVGMRLPATRALAALWGISRSTVVLAFEHLSAEGYLEARRGSGTFICSSLPEPLLNVRHPRDQTQRAATRRAEPAQLSARGTQLWIHYQTKRKHVDLPVPFRPGVPAVGCFPTELWRRLSGRRWRQVTPEALARIDPMGYPPLREALAVYLRAARGVRCEPEQVILVSSSQHAITLLSQILLDPGDSVWIEDPGYPRAQAALTAAGMALVPVPVDGEGLDLQAGQSLDAAARLVYITPSHQYPLGVTMSLSRRLAVLEWAATQKAWILEDDYVSEYRYAGRPLTALQGLDTAGRVIYMGTFSKLFSPALRLSYLVIPPGLVDPFMAARSLIDRGPSFGDQATMADFIQEGYFSRHIRRMRTLYAERQEILKTALQATLSEYLEVQPCDAGLHILGWLQKGMNDAPLTTYLAEQGIMAPALSYFSMTQSGWSGLVLGFAGWDAPEIKQGVEKMARGIRCFARL